MVASVTTPTDQLLWILQMPGQRDEHRDIIMRSRSGSVVRQGVCRLKQKKATGDGTP